MSEAKPAQAPDSQHFQRGVEIGRSEREREIIALLEAKSDWYYAKAIEAIKGETK